jgi:di/tricarboxylate transporter
MLIPPGYESWFALAVTACVFVGLQLRRGAPTDLLFLLGVVAVTVGGILSPEQAIGQFSSPAILTIGALLIVAEGLRSTGVLDRVGTLLLGGATTERSALLRLAPAMVAASAFLLNTALVAMMAPVVVDWCRKHRVSPSKMLLPLSYLTILGGVCTLIGTSTTLVANGILRARQDEIAAKARADPGAVPANQTSEDYIKQTAPLSLFEIGCVGVPCALVGTVLLLLVAPRLLPNRTDMLERLDEQRREYLVEMRVLPICPLIGQSVEQAGLRHLPGLFLIEIDRGGEILTPVTPHEVIHSDDRLVFTGVVSTIVDLEKINGLVPIADIGYEFQPETRPARRLTEVVLSRTSPLIGLTVREGGFRQRYNAAVVAVHRNGVRLTNKVGSISLEPGDTLLLQTRDDFVNTYRNSRDFYLVSGVEGWQPRLHHKAQTAAFLLGLLVLWLVLASQRGNEKALAIGAVGVACLMVAMGCLKVSDARSAIDLRVLLTIAGALGLGLALKESGAATDIAEFIINWVGPDPWPALIAVYLLTLFFTEIISNNAVAAMLLPVAIEVADAGDHNARPFIIAVTLVASLSFVTPIGYQTNLMVMGPGGYRPFDYARCGTPLALAVGVTAIVLIPRVWPF